MSWLDAMFNAGVPGPAGPAGAGAGVFAMANVALAYGSKQSESRTVGCSYSVNLVGLLISGASFWWPASAASTTVTVDLWDSVGNNLASITVTPSAGLNAINFASAFTVTSAYIETTLRLSLWNVSHSEVPAINPISTWPSAVRPSLPVMRDARGTRLLSLTQYNAGARGFPNTDNGGSEYYAIDPTYGN